MLFGQHKKTIFVYRIYIIMAYLFKIKLKGITKPPVWRKVSVPENFTFLRLHQVIQTLFGWYDYHLFEFLDKEYQNKIRIAIPSEDDLDLNFGAKTYDASKIKLSEIFSKNIKKLLYVYDFGDNWVHEITLESISEENPSNAYCISGKGSCPPEDCGGIYGYENLKQVFQTMPESEEAKEFREWLGLDDDDVWDPDFFCVNEKEDINSDLKTI